LNRPHRFEKKSRHTFELSDTLILAVRFEQNFHVFLGSLAVNRPGVLDDDAAFPIPPNPVHTPSAFRVHASTPEERHYGGLWLRQ
jgi:hypothetical protein